MTKNIVNLFKNTLFMRSKVGSKLTIIFILLIMIPLIVQTYLSFNNSYQILKNKLILISDQTLGQVNSRINEFFKEREATVNILSSYRIFADQGLDLELIQNVLKSNTIDNSAITTTFYCTGDGKIFMYPQKQLSPGYFAKVKPWYTAAVAKKGQVIWTGAYRDELSGDTTMTVAKAIVINGQIKGIIGQDINLKAITQCYKDMKLGKKGYVFISNSNGTIISHPNPEVVGLYLTDYLLKAKNVIIRSLDNKDTGWKIVSWMDKSELYYDIVIIRNYSLLVIVISSILAIILSLFFSKNFTNPIKKLQKAYNQASEGDLTVEAHIKSGDEFEELGLNFNSMIKKINQLVYDMQDSSKIVTQSSLSLAEVIDSTNKDIGSTLQNIEQIAIAAQRQANDTEKSKTEIQELSASINIVSHSIKRINTIFHKANELNNKGMVIVDDLMVKSKERNDSSTKINDLVLNVDESAKQIDVVTNSITQIAEQTNLLALNASIEAARAGEYGRGFAVVAQEVRKLASEAEEAAVTIKALVNNLQGKSEAAVSAIKVADSIATKQETTVSETFAIFEQISATLMELDSMVEHIKQSNKQMTDRGGELVSTINSIAALSEQTAASTSQVVDLTEQQSSSLVKINDYAQSLSGLAERLQASTKKFVIGNREENNHD